MSNDSRREALKKLAVATGGAALAGYVPGCTDDRSSAFVEDLDLGRQVDLTSSAQDLGRQGDLTIGPPDGGPPDGMLPDGMLPDRMPTDQAVPDASMTEPDLLPLRGDGSHPFHYIDTIIIVQMENRSFDHYFGALRLLEGRLDVDGLTGQEVNLTAAGLPISPTHLQGNYAISPDPGHGRQSSLHQWNDGQNDGFITDWERRLTPPAEGEADRLPWVLGYYNRDDLPASYGLADAFTLAHRWHCSLLGPTWPNRYFSHCASSGGLTSNNGFIDEPTPYLSLAEAGGTYKTYFTSLFFTLTITSLTDKRAVKLDEFFRDCEQGTLSNVNIVEPSFFENDDHPPQDVRNGQAFLATIYEAVRRSPQWNRCLMVVFYDEHGGFHDHVPPPESLGDVRAAEGFDRLGFRVPGLIIGPLVKRGAVLDTVVEHSSVPSLISNVFGLPHVNERSRLAGDLGDALDLALVSGSNRPPAPVLPPVILPEVCIEQAMHAAMNQPELQTWFRQMGMGHHASLPERRRLLRTYLERAHRMGTIRLV